MYQSNHLNRIIVQTNYFAATQFKYKWLDDPESTPQKAHGNDSFVGRVF